MCDVTKVCTNVLTDSMFSELWTHLSCILELDLGYSELLKLYQPTKKVEVSRSRLSKVRKQWHRQLWCTGPRAPWTSGNLFQLTTEQHKVYNGQLSLVLYSTQLWKHAKLAMRGVLYAIGSSKIVFVFSRGSAPPILYPIDALRHLSLCASVRATLTPNPGDITVPDFVISYHYLHVYKWTNRH